MNKKILIFVSCCVAAAMGQTDVKVISQQVFSPITVTASITLDSANEFLKAAINDPLMAPSKVIYHWGEKDAAGKQVYSESIWKTGQKSQTAQHVYSQPGDYGITISIVDAKNRLVEQRGLQIKINTPLDVKTQ